MTTYSGYVKSVLEICGSLLSFVLASYETFMRVIV